MRQFLFGEEDLFAEWVGGRTPILVYSPGDAPEGKLSDKQLVGDAMGGKSWSDGYAALASLDMDKSGYVEGVEMVPLYLWFDRNQDAVCQPDEVEPLSRRVSRMAYKVKPDALGDVSLTQGAQLISGQWVRTWDWWMNVWRYPILARYNLEGSSPYSLLFPTLQQTEVPNTSVVLYKWRITSVAQGNFAQVGFSGYFRIVPDPKAPGNFIVMLEDGQHGDVFASVLNVGKKQGSTLTWEARPERTEATVRSDGTLVGHTVSMGGDYWWEAEPVLGPTKVPLAGISDARINDLLGTLFDPEMLDPNGNAHLYLRGALKAPVSVSGLTPE